MLLREKRQAWPRTSRHSCWRRTGCLHVVYIQVLLDDLSDIVGWTILERREHVMLPLVLPDLLEGFLNLGVVEIELLLDLDVHAPLPVELQGDFVLLLGPLAMALGPPVLLLEHLRDHDVLGD